MKRIVKQLLTGLISCILGFRKKRSFVITENPHRILLLACHWLGDTFWAIQVLPLLQKRFPNTEFFIGVKPASKILLNGLLPDDRILLLSNLRSDRTRERFDRQAYQQERFQVQNLHIDGLIDLTGNRCSAWFAFRSNAKWTMGPNPADELSACYDFCVPIPPNPAYRHLIWKPFRIVAGLLPDGLPPDPDVLCPQPIKPRENRTELFQRLNWTCSEQEKIVLLLAGAGWISKQWPAQRFHELALRLWKEGYRIIVSGAKQDLAACRTIVETIPNALILSNDLAGTISLIPHCTMCIGADTGLIHIAAAFGIRTVVLFCGTNPEYCMPLGKSVQILFSSCSDRPFGYTEFCCNHSLQACPRSCCMDQSVEQVMEAISQFEQN